MPAADAEDARVFGRHLRALRESRGLTQGQLAERCGASRPQIANLEAGNNAPTLGTLLRLAKALECEPSRLLQVFDSGGQRRA